MGKAKILFLDMDDTLADFVGELKSRGLNPKDPTPMYEPGFFRDLKPIKGSLSAVRSLIKMGFDVQILTQPVAESPHSYAEKVQWIGMWFPELLSKINMVQNKGLVKGHYLVDDNRFKWCAAFEANGGNFIHFQYETGPENHERLWKTIVLFFSQEDPHE
jgi:5'(3')-deoxyribonucleotidase